MVENTKFEVEALTSETRYEELVKTHISSTIEMKYTMSPNYELLIVRREIVPPQRYGYFDFICYALNVAEGL